MLIKTDKIEIKVCIFIVCISGISIGRKQDHSLPPYSHENTKIFDIVQSAIQSDTAIDSVLDSPRLTDEYYSINNTWVHPLENGSFSVDMESVDSNTVHDYPSGSFKYDPKHNTPNHSFSRQEINSKMNQDDFYPAVAILPHSFSFE